MMSSRGCDGQTGTGVGVSVTVGDILIARSTFEIENLCGPKWGQCIIYCNRFSLSMSVLSGNSMSREGGGLMHQPLEATQCSAKVHSATAGLGCWGILKLPGTPARGMRTI